MNSNNLTTKFWRRLLWLALTAVLFPMAMELADAGAAERAPIPVIPTPKPVPAPVKNSAHARIADRLLAGGNQYFRGSWERTCGAAVLYESAGQPYLAIRHYGECSKLAPKNDLGRFAAPLKRAINAAAGLSPQPVVSAEAVDALEEAARSLVQLAEFYKGRGATPDHWARLATEKWEEASQAAPWWPEPYYAEAVYRAAAADNFFDMGERVPPDLADRAVLAGHLFLLASPRDDARRPEIERILAQFQSGFAGTLTARPEWLENLEAVLPAANALAGEQEKNERLRMEVADALAAARIRRGLRGKSRPSDSANEMGLDAIIRVSELGESVIYENFLDSLFQNEAVLGSLKRTLLKSLSRDAQISLLRGLFVAAKAHSSSERFLAEYLNRRMAWRGLAPNQESPEFPVSGQQFIKIRLGSFLVQTEGIDFKAETHSVGNSVRFVLPEYEEKSRLWKFCFRAGPELTQAARDIAADWLADLEGETAGTP